MKKIKNTVALLCAIVCLLTPTALAACGKTQSADNSQSYQNSNELPENQTPPDDFDENNGNSGNGTSNSDNTGNAANPGAGNSANGGNQNSSSSTNVSSPSVAPPSSTPPPASSAPNSSSAETSKPDDTKTQTAQYIRCTADNVNIRAGAGTGYAVLGSAKQGTMYAIIGKTGDWYKTYYRNKVAYVSASYFSLVTLEKSTNSDVEKVLSEGYKLIGVPYVYGAVRVHDGTGKLLSGFSSQKFDCSSLVQYVFYKGTGTLLQSHTRAQVKQGKYVKKSELRRGDCLFFTNEDREHKVGIERVGHVAIYLGNDYILHTASDYARIEKMTAYRWNYYIEARRFV